MSDNILYYPSWKSQDINSILKDIEKQRPERIVLFGENEWEMPHVNKDFVARISETNTQLNLVHGCFQSYYHTERYKEINLPIENVTFWGTHFFNHVYMHLSGRIETHPLLYKRNEVKHKFISLNNRSHYHRCVFIDEMAKENLLDEGVVTWIAHLNENSDYPYKYFDGNKRLLNDGFSTHLNSHSLPQEYHESNFEIVTESTSTIDFFTEKTVRNLLLKKPFMILGATGIHGKLCNLGFKLYDEVIDYSFDTVPDLEERTRLFVNNIHNILKYDPNELYELLLPKIIHNYNRAMMIATDMSLIPEYFKNIPNNQLMYEYSRLRSNKAKFFSIWNSWAGNDDVDNTLPHITGEMTMEKYRSVIILQAMEHAYNQLGVHLDGVDRIISNAKKHNVPVKLLTSTKTYETHSKLSIESEEYEHLECIDMPGYWISDGFYQTWMNREKNLQNGLDITNDNVNLESPIETLYITMNNLAHPHRCMMMDILAKYDLISKGAIAWRDIIRDYDNDRNETPDSIRHGYPYKYWTPERLVLDHPGLASYISQEVLPIEYQHAFMQLVGESTISTFFLTEKTAFSLLYNKIFLVVGSKNYHRNLEDMGFKLFHSLFDYSFDSIDDPGLRIEGVIKNINKYRDMTMNELETLLQENIDIINHNRTMALKYVFEINPKLLTEVCATLSGQNIVTRLDSIRQIQELRNAFFKV